MPKFIKKPGILLGIALLTLWNVFFFSKIFHLDVREYINKKLSRRILPEGICKDCNVILISLDTLRAKSLPCYGYEKNTAPNLCEFAKKSFLFTDSYSQSAYTLDSHFSIFTSLLPSSHGMITPFVSTLNDKVLTLTQILKNAEYKTIYAGPGNPTDPNVPIDRGIERGFDMLTGGYDPATWIEALQKNLPDKGKFFAFLHTYEVHEPYLPDKKSINKFYDGPVQSFITNDELCRKRYTALRKINPSRFSGSTSSIADYCLAVDEYELKYAYETYEAHETTYRINADAYWDTFKDIEINERRKYIQALYEAKVYELDQKLQLFFMFLEQKNLFANTILIFTSDHGEAFFEHGNWTHGLDIYNEVIKVPLIVYIPNTSPQEITKFSQGIDLMPTILKLVGLPVPDQVQGINLFGKEYNKFIISQHFGNRKRAIIKDNWKFIINYDSGRGINGRELYDIVDDPAERINLTETNVAKVNELESQLESYIGSLKIYDSMKENAFPTWINEEQRKRLIETGYF